MTFTDRNTFALDAAAADENGEVCRGDDGHGCKLVGGAADVVEVAAPVVVDAGDAELVVAPDEPGVLEVEAA